MQCVIRFRKASKQGSRSPISHLLCYSTVDGFVLYIFDYLSAALTHLQQRQHKELLAQARPICTFFAGKKSDL